MRTALFFLFVFFLINTSRAQVADTTKTANDKLGISIGSGVQVLITDHNNLMLGTNLVINSLWHHHIILNADLHAAISSRFLDEAEFYVHNISSVSLMPGYRFDINHYSAIQLQAGISYGALWYRGKMNSDFKNGTVTSDSPEKKINFIGLPLKLAYELFFKKVCFEIYISGNLHSHPESVAGLNVFLGKLK
jgi:hypothetical protein